MVATSIGTHRSLVARTNKCGWAPEHDPKLNMTCTDGGPV